MSKTYLIFDLYNLFFRAKFGVSNGTEREMLAPLLLHVIFSMFRNTCDKFKPDGIVIASDGCGSWRYDLYPSYKANRLEKMDKKTPAEIMIDEEAKRCLEEDLIPFLDNETNIPLLRYNKMEADDVIARFIALHPNDIVIIVSSDNDFVQLLNDNVFIYNAMLERIISSKCILDSRTNKPLSFGIKNGKINVPKEQPQEITELTPMKDWIEYALFSKCVRGDVSDNIMSAYPGVREKSTSKKVGVLDAFADRNNKGYNWNCFMNSKWSDPFGKEIIVKEAYEFNKKLVDMKEIPQEYKESLDSYILNALKKDKVSCVGVHLEKFFIKWNLNNLLNSINTLTTYFQRPYA